MRKSEMTNEQLLGFFINAVTRATNYPTNKAILKEERAFIKEICKRFNIDENEVDKIVR